VSITIGTVTGDGVIDPAININVELPDSGTTVGISGYVQAIGGPKVDLAGATVTMPVAPGSGSTFWNIQVDTGSGATTVQTSAASDPSPGSATSLVVFRQRLDAGVTDPALASTDSTPDTW
jgi:hypothetical protein